LGFWSLALGRRSSERCKWARAAGWSVVRTRTGTSAEVISREILEVVKAQHLGCLLFLLVFFFVIV